MADLFGLTVLAIVAILMTWSFDFVNGFHDSANSIATIVATKVLTPVQAVGMAAFFNFIGVLLVGEVAKTIQKGIIYESVVNDYGIPLVIAALLGAIIWDLITWWLGIPTSSSHALVGGLLGAGGAAIGLAAINWAGTLKTAAFIVISPLVGFVIGFVVVAIVMRLAKNTKRTAANKEFRRLQLVSSAFYSFTHGTNDAQKGMGIIMLILFAEGLVGEQDAVFDWVKVSCSIAIALGTFLGGWRIVKTMAARITKLEPYQGFSAETGAATMLVGTAVLGIPVSTTHTISGSIMGVGSARRLSAVRWGIGKRIVLAWILTIPAAATISGVIFLSYLTFF
ncbi:MAG: inorganic phosphate transporter [Thermoplasmata archaeon]|nr:inorganic phosphate transporter [Thermoplasmata archaeon]